MRVPLGAFILDSVSLSDAADRPALINTVPEDDETGVWEDWAIRLTVVDVGADGMDADETVVSITDSNGTVIAWDGTDFAAEYAAGSSFTAARSDGGGPDDEHRLVLVRDTAFESLEVITVRVQAATLGAQTLDTTYSFQIRDYTAPVVSAIETRGPRKLRVLFDEPVVQGTDEPGDALRVRRLYAAELIEPYDLYVAEASFDSDDVGQYVGVAGADDPRNNGLYRITAYISSQRVTLDADVIAEVLPDNAVLAVGPYGLAGVADADRVLPTFAPVIISAKAGLSASEVILSLHTDITFGGSYEFSTHNVSDLYENVLLDDDVPFVAEALPVPVERSFSLLDALPPHNFDEDVTRDLERFVRCLNEVAQLLLYDVDRFGEIFDIDKAPSQFLDVLLWQLGNPFRFALYLSDSDKRKLISILVEIYRRNGTEDGIEAVLNFFLGVPIDLQAYNLSDVWVLGTSQLGINTYLGPGTSFLRYAFEAVSPQVLTDIQRERLRTIVNFMKPAHTHFVRIVEPEA